MDENVRFVARQQLLRTQAALEKNNMETFVLDSSQEVVGLLQKLMPAGSSVANGGSLTLETCGVNDFLRSGAYEYLDRDDPALDKQKIQRQAFSADFFLASANAVTEQGEIYEVDGAGNRVAAIAYGPAKVILVAGRNKIVPDLEAAQQRRMRIAAPANCKRLHTGTPCEKTGLCADCRSPGRICCIELVLRFQLMKDRIKVVLVDEELGF